MTYAHAATFSSVSVPLCGYGRYLFDGICYKYAENIAPSKCPTGFHLSAKNEIFLLGRFDNGKTCMDAYSQYSCPDNLFLIRNGYLSENGAPIFSKKYIKENRCGMNSDTYYRFTSVNSTEFFFPDMYRCPENAIKYKGITDCRDVVTINAGEVQQKTMCAQLCDTGVYSNIGICVADGYCNLDNKNKRIYFSKNGLVRSVPLYASKVTSPALHIRFGATDTHPEKTCYINLIENKTDKGLRLNYNGTDLYVID